MSIRPVNTSSSVHAANVLKLVSCVFVFFHIARDAKIAHKEIMDVGMFDVRYLKIFNASHGCDDKILASMLYAAQQVSMVAVAHDFRRFHYMRMLSIQNHEPY